MPQDGEEPEVTETGYVAATKGPASDTETYYKATPAPGDWRDDDAGPPTQSSFTSKEPERLSLRRSRTGSGSGDKAEGKKSIPWVWIGAGVVAFGFIGLVTTVVAVYALLSNPNQDTQPEEEEKTWEGLKVKKGLR